MSGDHRECEPTACRYARNVAEVEAELQAAHGAIKESEEPESARKIIQCPKKCKGCAEDLASDAPKFSAGDRAFYDPPVGSFSLTYPIGASPDGR